MRPPILDTDQHVTPPPDFWTSRMSKQFQEMAPRVVDLPDGGQAWSFEGGAILHPFGVENVGGQNPKETRWQAHYDELDPAYYQPKARLEAMGADGITAALLFPSVAGQSSQIQDDALYAECLRTYNDAIWDWSQEGDPTRMFPTALIPCRDLETATGELARVAEKGFRHYQSIASPSGSPYPTAADDVFWGMVQDTGMVISMHGGGGPGRTPRLHPSLDREKVAVPPLRDQEAVTAVRAGGMGAPTSLALLVLTGVLERFPDLKIALIETSVGWFPWFVDQLDATYTQHRWLGEHKLSKLPSEYLANVKMNIDREIQCIKHRHQIGVDNVMFGTDFPHVGSFWPHSRFYLDLLFDGIPEEETEKILWGNGAALYGIDD